MILVALSARAQAAPITILNNGPSSNRVDIVFLGDGYTQANLDAGIYDRHIQGYLDHMFSSPTDWDDPFPRYQKFFNAHKIDLVSNESGADIPSQHIRVDTALDATYESSGIDRLLTVSRPQADSIRDSHLAGTDITADMQLVTVNHTQFGGSGGSWAVYAGGSSNAREIALHELGHSFSTLADEYVNLSGDYLGPEPNERNVTKNPTGAKWSHWIGFDDPRGSSLDIGVFPGAAFYPTGIYRPSSDSKMRSLDRPFDAVSREALIHDIYGLVDPLDDWLDNSSPVADVDLWVDVIDPDVIKVKWYVDDVLIDRASAGSFNPADFGFGAGTYEVRAHAYDNAIDHAFGGTMWDLVRTRFALLQQDVTWTYSLTAAPLEGDYSRDGSVDAIDYVVWRDTLGTLAVPAGSGADGDRDGTIGVADYAFWMARFGSVAAGARPHIQTPTVPEPMTAALLSIAPWLCGSLGVRTKRSGGQLASLRQNAVAVR
jgi:hypothetical protein